MKKILFAILLLVIGQLSLLATGLSLMYPVGGEKLPNNGKHTITWTNSADLLVSIYIDWYDTNGVNLVSNNVIYSAVLPEGTNNFILHEPTIYPTEFQYKVRLNSDTNNLTASSGFIRITSPARFTAQITNQNQWLPNQTRNINISWSGFETNDLCSLVLESPSFNKEGYGFLITNLMMASEGGTQTLTVAYPFATVPAYPPFSYDLNDGNHMFTVFNKRCDIVTTFGSIDMVTAGLRMYLGSGSQDYIHRGDSAECGAVFLDAILATNNVNISSIGIIFTSYSSNRVSIKCILKDEILPLSTNTLDFTPFTNEQYHTEVLFPMNLTVPMGTVKKLALKCEVLYDSGLGDFIWNTGEISTDLFGNINATYVDGATVSTKTITSSSDYVKIIEVINSKFITFGSQSNLMVFQISCKPSTMYDIETSTNLLHWNALFTTKSVENMLQINIPITNGNHFFRLKQN